MWRMRRWWVGCCNAERGRCGIVVVVVGWRYCGRLGRWWFGCLEWERGVWGFPLKDGM